MNRLWILAIISTVTLLFGGGIVVAPTRISDWVHGVAIEEVKVGLAPISVSLDKMQETLGFIRQLVKEIRDREINRGGS